MDLIATEPLVVVGGIQRRRVVAQQQGGVIFSVDELQPCNQRTGSTVINQATTQRRPSAAIESSSHLARHRRKRIYSTLHSTTNKKTKTMLFFTHMYHHCHKSLLICFLLAILTHKTWADALVKGQ